MSGPSAALDPRSVDRAFILVWGVEFIAYTLDIALWGVAVVSILTLRLNDISSVLEFSPIAHTIREYCEYPGAQYALPTDNAARKRLWLQHSCIKSLFDNRTLLAPMTLGPDDRVLDSRPGLWALDLAQSVDPAVDILGINIEPRHISNRIGHESSVGLEQHFHFLLCRCRVIMRPPTPCGIESTAMSLAISGRTFLVHL
ncbi:hypothetical protein DFH08DRAFT_954763 [Mycena albidolilacea]|uniref:Uncharacterized protein n=1 Tax=Mycena albidolilacea TaxID=1033008 RepID=A0AAD7ACK2_9AGAR|nr:hypothetical protein DFH08DRAFT_954763 [Mycena albidolilacea]